MDGRFRVSGRYTRIHLIPGPTWGGFAPIQVNFNGMPVELSRSAAGEVCGRLGAETALLCRRVALCPE